METSELPFAKIFILREDIAEVIINDGVEMNLEMVEQYHDYLLLNLRAPFSLLINKINAYSYSHDAQQKLATLREINAMAVLAYNRTTISTTKLLTTYPRDEKWNLKIFTDRDEAMGWLFSEQSEYYNRI